MSTSRKIKTFSITVASLAAVGVIAYMAFYLPYAHAQEVEQLETALEGKQQEVKQTVKEKEALDLQMQSEATKKKQALAEKEALAKEAEALAKAKAQLEADAKAKEKKLGEEKKKLESQVQQLEKDKKSLKDQVSAKKQREQAEKLVASAQPIPSRGSKASGKTIVVSATAYTANCKGCSGITATGLDVRNSTPKIIAVDPKVIPLGTKVELTSNGKSMGYYTAADKGGAIKGHKIDILVSSYGKAIDFGRKNIKLRVLK